MDKCLQDKEVDLEAWEEYLRNVVLGVGAKALEKIVQDVGCGRRNNTLVCKCGNKMRSKGLRRKTITTILGEINFMRSLFVCDLCGATRFPGDELLNVEETSYSPGARRMMSRAGSRTSFAESAEDLRIYANMIVNSKDIERIAKKVGREVEQWNQLQRDKSLSENNDASGYHHEKSIPVMYISFDGTGIPMQRAALIGRKGKQSDGSAKTREVKLGCIFTQTTTDDQGRPIRDPFSTTYVGAIESSEHFGWRIYAEALRRKSEQAQKVVIITDGARYNMSIVNLHFPNALHIIDLYHAREHLYKVSRIMLPESEKDTIEKEWLDYLDKGDIENLLADMKKRLPSKKEMRKLVATEMKYFKANAKKMQYSLFKDQGLFVGSGVIEAGCRSLIGERLKKSGMFWSVNGANAIIALRCTQYSNRFEQFWEDQAA